MNKINKSLLGGSIALLITLNLFNIINFLFQFSMARMLSVQDYSVLATLFSIIYILTVFSESIETVLTRYTSLESDKGKLKNIFKKSIRKSWKITLFLFIFYTILAIFLAPFLKIDYFLLVINGLFIFSVFLLPIPRGIMQGRKMFWNLGGNFVLEGTIKLLLAIFLVLLGFGIYGAIGATIISTFIAFFASFIALKSVLNSKESPAITPKIYEYTAPVFFATLIITIFYSIDIVVARILFDSTTSGYYSLASILAKTLFVGTQAISKAMFPFSANNKEQGKSGNIYTNSIVILIILIIPSLVIFYFFPDILVRIFAGRYIPESAKVLFYLAIASSLISFTNLEINYKLSQGKIKGYAYLIFFILIEILLFIYFSQSILSFSISFIISSFIFFLGSILMLRK